MPVLGDQVRLVDDQVQKRAARVQVLQLGHALGRLQTLGRRKHDQRALGVRTQRRGVLVRPHAREIDGDARAHPRVHTFRLVVDEAAQRRHDEHGALQVQRREQVAHAFAVPCRK